MIDPPTGAFTMPITLPGDGESDLDGTTTAKTGDSRSSLRRGRLPQLPLVRQQLLQSATGHVLEDEIGLRVSDRRMTGQVGQHEVSEL